jgi:hypothetical protein
MATQTHAIVPLPCGFFEVSGSPVHSSISAVKRPAHRGDLEQIVRKERCNLWASSLSEWSTVGGQKA